MYEQISILGEDVKCEAKAKKFEHILKELEGLIFERDSIIEKLEAQIKMQQETIEALKEENKAMDTKPKFIEVGAFEESKVNHRPMINIFVDWIGYEMFIKGSKFEKLPKEKQEIYREVWSKHIKPTYQEFCISAK